MNRRYPFLLGVALLVAVVAALPLMAEPGLLNTRGGGDSPFLLQRLHQLETAVLDGHFPARWMPDANYGYGYPFYNFYAPLSIYIAALFRLLGFSFVRAIQMAQLAGFLVAAWGMFRLASRWFKSDWAGLLAAVTYTLAPFHLVNVYVRGDSLAEFWAMAFYPLVILTADDLLDQSSNQPMAVRIVRFGLAYAALILSHNISAMIFSPFLLLFCSVRLWAQRPSTPQPAQQARPLFWPMVAGLAAGGGLALGLAAWFFVPALAEQSLAQLGSVTEGYFSYATHFLGTERLPLIQSEWLFDFTVNGRRAFRMGLVQTGVGLVSLLLLSWLTYQRRVEGAVLLFAGGTAVVATVMMLPLSHWLWANLPLLSFTQFPWRFLSVQAFGLSLAAGALGLMGWKRPFWTPLLVGLLLLSSLGRLQTDHLIVTDAHVTAESLAQYEWFTGNIGTTVSAEYLPPTMQPRFYSSGWLMTGERYQVTSLDSPATAVLLTNRTTHQQWQLETRESSRLIFPTLFWPGWQARLNDDPIIITPSAAGLIELTIPPGSHLLDLRLTRTPVRQWAEWLSLIALLLTASLSGPALIKFLQRRRRETAVLSVSLLLLTGLLWLWPEAAPPDAPLTWDFAEMGYLHASPEGISFTEGSRLLNYAIDRQVVTPGDTVTISLTWAETVPQTAVSLTTPAINRPEFLPAPPLFLTQQGEQTEFVFTIPDTIPSGLLVPQLRLLDERPLTPSGRSRGTLFLQPIRVVNQPAVATDGLDVQATAVTRPAVDRLQIELTWRTAVPLEQNLAVALRLVGSDGTFLQLADQQPGYGYLPSSQWPTETAVFDWHTMAFPTEVGPEKRPFWLIAQLYDPIRPQNVWLTRRLGAVEPTETAVLFTPHTPQFDLPDGEWAAETAVFGEQIALRGVQVVSEDEQVTITVAWEAVASIDADYTRFVHLVDPEQPGPPLAQVDSFVQQNTYPTSQWVPGEIVVETVKLDLSEVPAGAYRLAVGFYRREGEAFPRLTAVDAQGAPLPENRLLLETAVTPSP